MGKRHRAREAAFKAIFAQQFNHDDPATALERIEALAEDARPMLDDFSRTLVLTVFENRSALEDRIRASLKGWTWERLGPSAAAILLLGAGELLHHPETDAAVAIDEYVELAKSYGEDETPGFINAVLDRIRKDAKR